MSLYCGASFCASLRSRIRLKDPCPEAINRKTSTYRNVERELPRIYGPAAAFFPDLSGLRHRCEALPGLPG